VLQHRDTERRVERAIGERQVARIRGAERRAQVVAAGGLLRDQGAIDRQVDADEGDLGDTEPGEPQLDAAGAAPDVENPVADPGAEPLDEEGRKGLIPPFVADMLESSRSQRVEGARRGRHWPVMYLNRQCLVVPPRSSRAIRWLRPEMTPSDRIGLFTQSCDRSRRNRLQCWSPQTPAPWFAHRDAVVFVRLSAPDIR
jgi:hypothetical protein